MRLLRSLQRFGTLSVATACIAVAGACTDGLTEGGADTSPADGARADGGPPLVDGGSADASDGGPGLDGAALYAAHCASCHGGVGEGGSGPVLGGWSRGYPALLAAIDGRMPLGAPQQCSDGCPDAVARYILTLPPPAHVSCDPATEAPGPATLRLLTRPEIDASVRDLFEGDRAACSSDDDCALGRESCVAGSCARDLCGSVTFTYDDGGHAPTRVHVAGDMNNWPATAAGGGWAMHKIAGTSTWTVKHVVAPGPHEYKIVVDESVWIADATRHATAPDGFGGSNSIVTVACDGAPGLGAFDVEWSAALPDASHPPSFPFDDHAASGIITSVFLDEAVNLADRAAALAATDVDHLAGCDVAVPGCIERFVDDLGERAWRRPLLAEERTRLMALARSGADTVEGVRLVIDTVLTSPSFLYRSELGVDRGDGVSVLTGEETASLLSYFLWGTAPDRVLRAAAARGDLATGAGRETQARRLLGDPRARTTLGRFAEQWLGVTGVMSVEKNAALGAFEAPLRAAMLEEARRDVARVALDGGHFRDLFTGTSSFVNGTLAGFYGIAGVGGENYSLVPLPAQRAGILTLGSVLAVTAYPDQTSPVRRGLFVRRRLLCEELGTPPPNAGAIPQVDPAASTRARFEQHSSNPQCAACHRYIDDIGFGFERFDPMGRVRADDAGHAIDDSGNMRDIDGLGTGTDAPFSSVDELAQILADSTQAPACFTQQMFRFAHGRLEASADACALERLRTAFADADGDIAELMVSIVRDDSFVLRGAP